MTFTLNVTTSSAANCTYYDVSAGTTGNAMTGTNTIHTASVTASRTGDNVYTITCVESVYGFNKTLDVPVSVLSMFKINIPGNDVGFLTDFPDFVVWSESLSAATGLTSMNV
jgi:hypothetical protein